MTKTQRPISSFFGPKAKQNHIPNGKEEKSKELVDLTSEDDHFETSTRLNAFKRQAEDAIDTTNNELNGNNLEEINIQNDKKRIRRSLTPVAKSRKPTKSKGNASKLTPLERQIIEFKQEHQDKVLAIQVGYKFKFFASDAVKVSKILNIMLIPGKINLDESADEDHDRIAYCSIPDNRLHVHLQRLLDSGLKVGVIKQTETAAIKSMDGNKNSIFTRELTAVYTKATYMDDEMLTMSTRDGDTCIDEEFGKFILCIDESDLNNLGEGMIYMVAVSPSTGEIIYDQFRDGVSRNELETRLTYLTPSEVLVINNTSNITKETKKIIKVTASKLSSLKHQQKKKLQEYNQLLSEFANQVSINEFKASQLTEYFLSNFNHQIQSCIIHLIETLSEFKLSNIFSVPSNITIFSDSRKFMLLPGNTLDQLEIFRNSNSNEFGQGSLIWILNHTKSKMGQRLLCKWISKPLVVKSLIEERLDAITDLKTNFIQLFEVFLQELEKIGKLGLDFEKCLIKIHYASNNVSDKINRKETFLFLKSMNELLQKLNQFQNIFEDMLKQGTLKSTLLIKIIQDLISMSNNNKIEPLLNMINPGAAVDEKDLITQKVNFFNLKNCNWPEITHEQTKIAEIESKLEEELSKVRQLLKRPQLNYVTNMKESYLIEVRNGNMAKMVPLDWLKISATKSVSRFRSPEISRLYKDLQYHQDMLVKSSEKAYKSFLGQIDDIFEEIMALTNNISQFDCLTSLTAASGMSSNLCKPEFVEESIIDVKKGRNPIIEMLSASNSYIPNDIYMSHDENRTMIITGPNMGGKSSYVRQVALIVVMAQIGCYVPCESAKLGVFDAIFTRMGAQDNIIKGESTFMVEMMECSNIISKCTEKSLVILDEIGRGTGTTDGIALAYSILDYFINDSRNENKPPLTLFITHYPSLGVFEDLYPNIVRNYHMGFIEEQIQGQEWPNIVFLYTLAEGIIENSYGLNVARLAGIPNDIISKAFKMSQIIKTNLEFEHDKSLALEGVKIFNKLLETKPDNPTKLFESINELTSNL